MNTQRTQEPHAAAGSRHAHQPHRDTNHMLGLVWWEAGVNDDGSVELYARVPVPRVGLLETLEELVGGDDSLHSVVAGVLGPRRPPASDSGLPHPSGVSAVMAADGTPVAVTWFAFANALWSSDARTAANDHPLVRRRWVEVAPGSLPLYGALAAGGRGRTVRHGMVGVGVDRAGATWLEAGLRPT